jgi:hypothetical protein
MEDEGEGLVHCSTGKVLVRVLAAQHLPTEMAEQQFFFSCLHLHEHLPNLLTWPSPHPAES